MLLIAYIYSVNVTESNQPIGMSDAVHFTLTASDAESGISSINVNYKKNGSSETTTKTFNSSSWTKENYTYSFSIDSVPASLGIYESCDVVFSSIEVIDKVGNKETANNSNAGWTVHFNKTTANTFTNLTITTSDTSKTLTDASQLVSAKFVIKWDELENLSLTSGQSLGTIRFSTENIDSSKGGYATGAITGLYYDSESKSAYANLNFSASNRSADYYVSELNISFTIGEVGYSKSETYTYTTDLASVSFTRNIADVTGPTFSAASLQDSAGNDIKRQSVEKGNKIYFYVSASDASDIDVTNSYIELQTNTSNIETTNHKVNFLEKDTNGYYKCEIDTSDFYACDWYVSSICMFDTMGNMAYSRDNLSDYTFIVTDNGTTSVSSRTVHFYAQYHKNNGSIIYSDATLWDATNVTASTKMNDAISKGTFTDASSLQNGWYYSDCGEYKLVTSDTYVPQNNDNFTLRAAFKSVQVTFVYRNAAGEIASETRDEEVSQTETVSEFLTRISKPSNSDFDNNNLKGWYAKSQWASMTDDTPAAVFLYMNVLGKYPDATVKFNRVYRTTEGKIKTSEQTVTYYSGQETYADVYKKLSIPEDAASGTSFTSTNKEMLDLQSTDCVYDAVAEDSEAKIFVINSNYSESIPRYAQTGEDITLPATANGKKVDNWTVSYFSENTYQNVSKTASYTFKIDKTEVSSGAVVRVTPVFASSSDSSSSSGSSNSNSSSSTTATTTTTATTPAVEQTTNPTKKLEPVITPVEPTEQPKIETPQGVEIEEKKMESIKEEITNALAELDKILEEAGTTEDGKVPENGEAEKPTVTIPMENEDGTVATMVPTEVLELIAGKDIDVVLDMGGYSWTINGGDVDPNVLSSINLEVKLGGDAVPENLVNALVGDKPSQQISLTHEGDFGFKANLTLNLGSEYAGQYGNLYYYDSDGKLIFMNAGRIDEDGNASMNFSHASDYIVVIGEEETAKAGTDITETVLEKENETTEEKAEETVTEAETDDSAAPAETEASNSNISGWPFLIIGIVLLVVIVVCVIVKRKRED